MSSKNGHQSPTFKTMTSYLRRSESELLFEKHLAELGLEFEREVRFHPRRKWRWDFVLPKYSIAIEIDGYFRGWHGKGWGAQDNDKQNHGVMLGWRVLRFSTNDVLRGRAKAFLADAMRWRSS